MEAHAGSETGKKRPENPKLDKEKMHTGRKEDPVARESQFTAGPGRESKAGVVKRRLDKRHPSSA